MNKLVLRFLPAALAVPALLAAQQIPFTDQSSLLPSGLSSGNSIAVCDMNNDGKDDIVRASQNVTMFIDYQQAPNALFTEQSFSNYLDDPWAMCVGDVNNDMYNDVMWGGGSVYVYLWNGSQYVGGNATTAAGQNYIFVQGTNFADVNNDGNLDVFSCNDIDMPHIYLGNGSGGWTDGQSTMPLATFPASDNSGNYASIWSDINNDGLIDLMITHCHQGVTDPNDGTRVDQVFLNNGNGTYTQDITNTTGLRDGSQGWSTAFGDIDNDGDMDAFILNYDVNSKLMINNGSGVFTDAMAGSGINNTTTIFGENATFQDFNNDGFTDLFISGSHHLLYVNDGDGTFTLDANAFVFNNNTITAHAIGDLNGDGFLDLYASYCNIFNTPSSNADRLWMNSSAANGNTNHWIKFQLHGVQSNSYGVGAIVKIYGPWGVQVREVRSGEGYGIQNSFTMHFGLGQNTAIDSAVITWPSGTTDHLWMTPGDDTYIVIEGGNPMSVQHSAAAPQGISIFPNPVAGQSTITLNGFTSIDNLSLNIFDINGRIVYTETMLQRNVITIDAKAFSSGLYFVEIRDGEKRIAAEKMLVP
jgi:hypothetical protein